VNRYQKILAKRAPELDPIHMETLAIDVGSILEGMPAAFFDEIVAIARRMGPDRLREWHETAMGQ